MTIQEIKEAHEAAGGRFFLAMLGFYGFKPESFRMLSEYTMGELVVFKLRKKPFGWEYAQEVFTFNPLTNQIN